MWAKWCKQPISRVLAQAAKPMLPAEVWKARSSLLTVPSSVSVLAATQKMCALNLTYLCVVDDQEGTVPLDEGRVVGLATERNVLHFSLQRGDKKTKLWKDGLPMASVEEITTPSQKLICVKPSDEVSTALSILNRSLYRHLPVIDQDADGVTRCHGILKLRDLLAPVEPSAAELPGTVRVSPLRRLFPSPSTDLAADGMKLTPDKIWGELTCADLLGIKMMRKGVLADEARREGWLKEYMASHDQRDVTKNTVNEYVSVRDAMRELVEKRLTFMVITSDSGAVSGIITERDCMRAIGARETMDISAQAVTKIMTPLAEMSCTRATDSASSCLSLMLSHQIRHLPVLSADQSLAGVLSLRDMLPEPSLNLPCTFHVPALYQVLSLRDMLAPILGGAEPTAAATAAATADESSIIERRAELVSQYRMAGGVLRLHG